MRLTENEPKERTFTLELTERELVALLNAAIMVDMPPDADGIEDVEFERMVENLANCARALEVSF